MTQPDRTPYCTKIRYGITGAPSLTEDEMDGSHAPGVGVAPTLIELVYSVARDGKPAAVSASVTGDWMRFGERDGGQVTTHFKNGPDGWPAWLAAEARLHDPDAPAVPAGQAPATGQAGVAGVRALHQPSDTGECRECHASSPCPTIRTLDAAEPATDQTALRDRIAEALYRHSHPGWATRYADLDRDERDRYLGRADAVLSALPASVDRAAVLDRIREVVRRLAAHAVGFKDVLDDADHGPWGRTVGADIAELIEALSDQPAVEPAVGAPQLKEADGDRVVAYRSDLPGAMSIYCTRHTDELGDGVMPLTSDDLPDGGVCAACHVDVLIPQPKEV